MAFSCIPIRPASRLRCRPAGRDPWRAAYFKDPGGGRFLLVDQTTEPKDDPLTDWQANEPSVADRLSGYERISLDRVEYRLEHRRLGVRGTAAMGRSTCSTGTFGGDARAYALYWSTPESEWADSRGMFDVITASFSGAS